MRGGSYSHSRALPACAWLLFTMLSACGATPPLPMATSADFPAVTLDASEWPGAAKLLSGFAEPDADLEWRTGDSLLYGVRFQNGDDTQRWLVRLWTSEPGTEDASPITFTVTPNDGSPAMTRRSRRAYVQFTVLEADGQFTSGRISIRPMPRDFFDQGLVGGGGLMWREDHVLLPDGSLREATPQEKKEGLRGALYLLACITSFQEPLQDDPLLSPYFWRIVEKPIGAILLAFGQVNVKLNVGNVTPTQRPWPAPLAPLPAVSSFDLPLDVLVNDVCVMRARLLVVKPKPPLSVGAGILAVSAVHPTNPLRRADIVLLGSARGEFPRGAPPREQVRPAGQ